MSSNNNKLDTKSKQLIIGIFAVLILLTFSAVMLIAAFNYDDAKGEFTTTTTEPAAIIQSPSTTLSQNIGNNNITTTADNRVPDTVVNNNVTQEQQEPISVEGLEEFTKTGENQISVSADNEFIKLVVQEEGAEAERLVAIYAIPDLGNNFVLEFDNKYDDNGNIIRSPKTLKKIYHINKERKITVATGKPTGNEGVDYGTSLMTYYLVTDVVMPEFPDYFTDVG